MDGLSKSPSQTIQYMIVLRPPVRECRKSRTAHSAAQRNGPRRYTSGEQTAGMATRFYRRRITVPAAAVPITHAEECGWRVTTAGVTIGAVLSSRVRRFAREARVAVPFTQRCGHE